VAPYGCAPGEMVYVAFSAVPVVVDELQFGAPLSSYSITPTPEHAPVSSENGRTLIVVDAPAAIDALDAPDITNVAGMTVVIVAAMLPALRIVTDFWFGHSPLVPVNVSGAGAAGTMTCRLAPITLVATSTSAIATFAVNCSTSCLSCPPMSVPSTAAGTISSTLACSPGLIVNGSAALTPNTPSRAAILVITRSVSPVFITDAIAVVF